MSVLPDQYSNRSHVFNQMLDIVHKFASKFGIYQAPNNQLTDVSNWAQHNIRMDCVDKIIDICDKAKRLLSQGGRVIQVRSPSYVLGDIHGNLQDLLIYEKVIWKQGPYLGPTNYIFLGDYVDQGDYSVECIVYLLCMKLQAPERFFMLRGGHESREVQSRFTFLAECKVKFGTQANRVFEAINSVFDVMPLVAILGDSFYCTHGGIPSSATQICQIMQVSLGKPLDKPESEPIAMEVLSNEPITDQEYADLLRDNQQLAINISGFLTNTKRATGFYFSEQALVTFLNANSLTHLIRAHSCPAGYEYHAAGKCISISSPSHCGGHIYEMAVAYAHDSQIEIIKVVTTEQA